MSYGRNPYYIYSDGSQLYLDGVNIDEKIINAFLYKVLLLNRREEFKRRLKEGKESWLEQYTIDEEFNLIEYEEDHPQVIKYFEWMNSQEDNIIKMLLGE